MARKDIFDRIDSKMRNQLATLGRTREDESPDSEFVEKRVSRRVIRRRARKPKPGEVAEAAGATAPAVNAPAEAEAEAEAEPEAEPEAVAEVFAPVEEAEAPSEDEAVQAAPEELPEPEIAPEAEPGEAAEPVEPEVAEIPAAPEEVPAAEEASAAPAVEPEESEPEAAAEASPAAPDEAATEEPAEPEAPSDEAPEAETPVEPEAAAEPEQVAEASVEPEPAAEAPAEAAGEAAVEAAPDAVVEAVAPPQEVAPAPLPPIADKPANEKSLEELLREQGIVQHKPKKGRRIIDQAPLADRRPVPKPVIRHDIRAQQMLKQARQAGAGGTTAAQPEVAGQPRDGSRRRSLADQRIERDLRAERERERKLQATQRKKKGRRKSIVQRPDMMYYPDRRSTRKKGPSRGAIGQKTLATIPKEAKRVIRIEDEISVSELAKALGVKAPALIRKFIEMGQMVTLNQFVDAETATLIAGEFDYRVENVAFKEEEILAQDADTPEDLAARPPVITVMGHVDHGKTSILDTIRDTRVAAREAGGITQHIGAYQVDQGGSMLTFLDTPGHEAFTAMRARGAQVTDLVVLVVAANDGVMPQTIEAIAHARAAEVPILVAINKIDLANKNIDRVKQELSEQGLQPEDWGGDTVMVPVSATKNIGIDDLLEMIALQAEMLELSANPTRDARGIVVEANLSKGVGPVATVLVKHGTLKRGDYVVAGTAFGRIRAMKDYAGKALKEAPPATPVEIHGLSTVPDAGDEVAVVEDERSAKAIMEHRQAEEREKSLTKTSRVTADMLGELLAAQGRKELNLVLKTDVHGSQEALREAILQIEVENTTITILHAAVGGITENDVTLAAASNGLVIGFHVRPDVKASKLAERQGVEIRTYRVIYEALEEIEGLLTGLLDPEYEEKTRGTVEVRNIFKIPKTGVIAGCFVIDGNAARNHKVRLLRQGVVLWEGRMSSLKRFKDDVKEVAKGFECGIGLQEFHDIKKGDVIETYTVEEIARA